MLTVCHLYPNLLNLYGDRGNVIAFLQRCRWRNIPVRLLEVDIGEELDFSTIDFLFLGGGSDREQKLITEDMHKRRKALKDAIDEGLVMLAICGGYQLLGRYYKNIEGDEIPGLGLFDFYTVADNKRLIGNAVVEVEIDGETVSMTGFENHSGRTYLGDVQPMGKVLVGHGNNGKDGTEGIRYNNVFCSYLHGPLLPKNYQLTDHLIKAAIRRRGGDQFLSELNNSFEQEANKAMLKRLLKGQFG
ncbi:type 1 glutamine amidotransferase [Desulfofalx alkaliphila]|uniref:type 1 glutamine amidotransferase n=1 Tax=Desulfofalx alkaliphila TaxID=105483 RepID=UPI0004E25E92|nr:glutamine amidotransferase [Desulfofalx alkaliphila]